MSMLRGAEPYKQRWRPAESVEPPDPAGPPGQPARRAPTPRPCAPARAGGPLVAKARAPWLRTVRDRLTAACARSKVTPMSTAVLHVAQPRRRRRGRLRARRLPRPGRPRLGGGGGLPGRRPARRRPGRAPASRRSAWIAGRKPGPGVAGRGLRLGRDRRALPARRAAPARLEGRPGRPAPDPVRRRLPMLFQPHGWSWLAVDGALRDRQPGLGTRAPRGGPTCSSASAQAEAEAGPGAGGRGPVRGGAQRRRPAAGSGRPATTRGPPPGHRLGVSTRRAPLAVCVGRVTRQKGQDVLLAAWPRGPARTARTRGSRSSATATCCRRCAPAAPGVTFAGAVADVRAWLAAADAGGAAVALGRAVADRAGGVRHRPRSWSPARAGAGRGRSPPRSAPWCRPDDPAALADAVARRLCDPPLTRAEGGAAARHAARFDLRHTFDQLAAVTAGVAVRHRASARRTTE